MFSHRLSSLSTSPSFVPVTTRCCTSTPASKRCRSRWVAASWLAPSSQQDAFSLDRFSVAAEILSVSVEKLLRSVIKNDQISFKHKADAHFLINLCLWAINWFYWSVKFLFFLIWTCDSRRWSAWWIRRRARRARRGRASWSRTRCASPGCGPPASSA